MKQNTKIKALALSAAALCGLAVAPAGAQNANYDQASGDIVLFFQQFGGSQTLMLNIGTGQSFRDATSNLIDLKNIGTELSSAFGSSWYDDANLYWGVAGVRSTSAILTQQVNGDPNRTIYATQGRSTLGVEGSAQSAGWSGFSNTDMTTGSGNIVAMTNRMETVATTDRLVEGTGSSNVDNQNPFLGSNPGTAYGIFPGGVEGKFGVGSLGAFGGQSAEGALDLYRILASTSASGQVGGTLREGSYEGSFVIDNGGDVSFVVSPVPEPTATVALLALGCVTGAMRRRRRVIA